MVVMTRKWSADCPAFNCNGKCDRTGGFLDGYKKQALLVSLTVLGLAVIFQEQTTRFSRLT